MKWFYKTNNKEVGPLSESALSELHNCGTIPDDCLVRKEDSETWINYKSLSTEEEISEFDKPIQTPSSGTDTIKFNCPHCEQHISTDSSAAGISSQCPSCGGEITVPSVNRSSLRDEVKILPPTLSSDGDDSVDESSVSFPPMDDTPKQTPPSPPPIPARKAGSSATNSPQRETSQHKKESSQPNEDIAKQAKEAAKMVGDVSREAAKVIGETGKKAADYAKEQIPQQTEFVRESFGLFYKRCKLSRAVNSVPTERETELLASAGVKEEPDRTLMVWRRSLLFLGVILMALTAVFKLNELWVYRETLNDSAFLVTFIITLFPTIMIGIAAIKTWGAYRQWYNIHQSRRLNLHAACALSSQLILLSVIPLSKCENLAEDEIFGYGLVIAIVFGIAFTPTVLGLAFGTMRGCLAARMFNPNNPIPGSMLLVASGLGFIIVLLISGLAVQLSGSLLISISFLFLLLLIANNARAGYKLKDDISKDQILKTAVSIEKISPWFIGLAFIFAVIGGWDLLKHLDLNFVTVLQMIIGTAASFCILTIAFCDLVTLMIRKGDIPRGVHSEAPRSDQGNGGITSNKLYLLLAILILIMVVVYATKPLSNQTRPHGGSTTERSDSLSSLRAHSSNIGRSVTAVNKGVGGGARIKGRIEAEQNDRVKVSITYISPYAVNDLAPYGYGQVRQGDSVWTPKRVWSID